MNLQEVIIQPVQPNEQERFQSLMKTHHYLGALPKIGHALWYVASRHNEWLALISFPPQRGSVRHVINGSAGAIEFNMIAYI